MHCIILAIIHYMLPMEPIAQYMWGKRYLKEPEKGTAYRREDKSPHYTNVFAITMRAFILLTI